MKKVKKLVFVIWIIFLVAGLLSFIAYPDHFSAENIRNFLMSFNQYFLVIYVLISLTRGFLLLPSTPFVLAGSLLFPEKPVLILIISLICILLSSAMIYYFSEFIGFDSYFKKKYPEKMAYLKKKLNQPQGFFFIVLWSTFPFAPTDLVSYVSGSIRMNVFKFLAAIFLGELPICAFYIFASRTAFSFLN